MMRIKNRVFMFLAVALAATSHAADPPAPADPSRVESQQKAAARLAAMTKYLASLPAYQVTCRSSYDVLQDSGQKLLAYASLFGFLVYIALLFTNLQT